MDAPVGPAAQRTSELQSRGWKQRTLSGFIDLAGPIWTCKESAGWAYGFLAESRHLNPASVVHGGMLATLIDHALSSIAWEAAGRARCVTLQLDTHFIAPVRAGMFVEARGQVVQRTSSLMFMQGALVVEGQPVLTAQALVKIQVG